MKCRLILLAILALTIVESAFPHECEDNFSDAHYYLRQKDYDTAYEYWKKVYTACPDIQRNLYTDGERIMEGLYKRAKANNDESEQIRIANLIMDMYDKRIEYFGEDKRYPPEYLLSCKAVDYKKYFEGTKAYCRDTVYVWLRKAMKRKQPAPSLPALSLLFDMSYENYMEKKGDTIQAAIFKEDCVSVYTGLKTLINDSTSRYQKAAVEKKAYVLQKINEARGLIGPK